MKLLLISLIILLSPSAWATTWYVRDGGGTTYGTSAGTNVCNGQSNVVYSLGVSPNCALNTPMQIIGFGCGNYGTSTCDVTKRISGSDTLYIDGDSDSSPGSQAVYNIGYYGVNGSQCGSSFEYGCTLANLPAGSSGNPTSVIGTGSHRPKLLGIDTPWQILNADNNYLTIENLEITDNLQQAYEDPTDGGRSEDGIELDGGNLVISNVYVHGLNRYGIVSNDSSIGPATFTNLSVIGNGYGGFSIGDGQSISVSGTLTFNQPIVEWNGCVEAYPLSGGIDNPSNYSNCFGQSSGGYGDGLAFGPSGFTNAGNWTIIGPGSISFNTQDGLDTLHGDGNGTIQIDKMRFEGNAGNQVKMNATTVSLTNSVVVADCGWWYGASQSLSGGMQPGDSCRALGDAILFNVTNNSTANLLNNTIVSNGNITEESKDVNSTGCNQSGGSGTQINSYNNIVLGGYSWEDDHTWNGSGGNSFTTYRYNAGNDGDGSGTCGNLTWNEDYNVVSWSSAQCTGAHDKCNTSPGFTGSIPIGTSGGGASSYYQGQVAVTLVPLGGTSAAIGAGKSGLSFWNNSNDYYNNTQTSPVTDGAMILSSCATNSFEPCLYNSDCCSGSCSNNVCTGGSTQDTFLIGNMNISGGVNVK